jgi:hypothetical protein
MPFNVNQLIKNANRGIQPKPAPAPEPTPVIVEEKPVRVESKQEIEIPVYIPEDSVSKPSE